MFARGKETPIKMDYQDPSMLTPPVSTKDALDCPTVLLPIAPLSADVACAENSAYVKFADLVSKKVTQPAINVGVKVDHKLIDILAGISDVVIGSVAITAAYTSLLLMFPDIGDKINRYQAEAARGWETAQKRQQNGSVFSAGFVEYLLPPTEAQQKWFEETQKLERHLEQTQNPFVRALAQARHAVRAAVPTKEQVRMQLVAGTAEAAALAARATAATVRGVAAVAGGVADYASDMSYGENRATESDESKVARYGGYLDVMSGIGEYFNARQRYFNNSIPPYLQWIGPLAPYAIIASLAPSGWLAGGIVSLAWPTLQKAAAWAIRGSQTVANVKSNAAIDSVKFVLVSLHEMLKKSGIPKTEYSDIFARTIVAISCPQWSVRDSDAQLFLPVDKREASPLLYFLRYATYAYCIDPKTLKATDYADCVQINRQFSRRYYKIMENVKGVEGFKKKLVNFFLVYDLTIGCFVASFQGTTTLDDVLLDAFGEPTPLQFTDKSSKASTQQPATVSGHAHKSMLEVAENCVELLIGTMAKTHKFYLRIPLIVTGHSLGAGVASIAALLLRQQGVRAYCLGLATPACLSPELATACEQFTVTVVNNADIVPRLSECALYNLKSSDRVCAIGDRIVKLVTPGNVLWLRRKPSAPNVDEQTLTQAHQELVKLGANNPFSTSILARIDCLAAHSTTSYLESLKSVDPNADADAIDFDFSFLFPTLPVRKLEPEFLPLYLPPNVAAAVKSCVDRRQVAKAARRTGERQPSQQEWEDSQKACQEYVATINELRKHYTRLLKEKKTLEMKLSQKR